VNGRELTGQMLIKDVVSRKKDPATGKVIEEELECGHKIDVRCLTAGVLRRRCSECKSPKARLR